MLTCLWSRYIAEVEGRAHGSGSRNMMHAAQDAIAFDCQLKMVSNESFSQDFQDALLFRKPRSLSSKVQSLLSSLDHV